MMTFEFIYFYRSIYIYLTKYGKEESISFEVCITKCVCFIFLEGNKDLKELRVKETFKLEGNLEKSRGRCSVSLQGNESERVRKRGRCGKK